MALSLPASASVLWGSCWIPSQVPGRGTYTPNNSASAVTKARHVWLIWLKEKSSYCSWAAIPTNLIMLPVPDIECWLFECLDSLLGQCVLYAQNKKYRQNRKRVSRQMYIRVYIPLGNWEHHVLESPSSHPLRSCICTDSLLWIRRRDGLLNIDFGSFGFPWRLWKMCHIIFFYLPPPLEVISSRSFFRSFLHFSISTTFRPSTSTGQHNNTACQSHTISASISEFNVPHTVSFQFLYRQKCSTHVPLSSQALLAGWWPPSSTHWCEKLYEKEIHNSWVNAVEQPRGMFLTHSLQFVP